MNKATRDKLANLLSGLDYDDMKEAYGITRDMYKAAIEHRNAAVAVTIAKGDLMVFESSKRSKNLLCLIEKRNRKTIDVIALNDTIERHGSVQARNWRVNPGGLRPATDDEIKQAVELAKKISFPPIKLRKEYTQKAKA